MQAGNSSSKITSNLTNWNAEREFLGRFYISQGLTEEQHFTNDCGPASLACVVNMLHFQANLKSIPLNKDTAANSSGFKPWERLPYWIPNVGGATAPWGMANAFNRWAEKLKLDWQAERRSHARRAHVIEQLMSGRPVTALKIWKTGGAHWINLVRYASDKDRLYFIDPNPFLEHLPLGKRLQSQQWIDFESDWSRQCWWSRLFNIHCEIITYSKTT